MTNLLSNGLQLWMHWEWDAKIVEFFNHLTEIKFFEIFFKGVAYLGTEYAVIVLFGITYWIFDKRMAKDIGISVFVAMLFNGLFKGIVNRPRPYQQFESITLRDKTIQYESELISNQYVSNVPRSTSTSFPSGHSQNSSSMFNSFALELNDKKKMPWLFIVANVLTLLIMISRLALGAHFFTDVLAGYILGLGIVLLFRLVLKKVKNQNLLYIVIIGVFGVITFLTPIWSNESKDMFTVFGSTVGIFLGSLFEEKKVDFKPVKCWWKALIRLALGIGIAIGFKTVFKYTYSWFVPEASYWRGICDMIRYFLMTFIACGLYPVLIKKWSLLND